MSRKTLWVFGCSFTAEYHPVGDPQLRSNYDDYKDWRGGNLPKVWPSVLAEMIDYDVKNCGEGGAANQTIFWKFIDEHKNFRKGDLVIIGWTSILRFAAYNQRDVCMNSMLPSNINTNVDHILSDQALTEIFNNRSYPAWNGELWKWVSLINTFCNLSGVKILHWNSDGSFFHKDYIDKDQVGTFIRTPDGSLDVFEFSRRLYSNGENTIEFETFGEVLDLHSGELGHLSQAQYFYEFIKNNRWKNII
jgi:hypothetical protein